MRPGSRAGPGAVAVVRLLLANAWRRGQGRRARARQIARVTTSGRSSGLGGFAILFVMALMMAFNLVAALAVRDVVLAGQRVEAERHGRMVVDDDFLREAIDIHLRVLGESSSWSRVDGPPPLPYQSEASSIAGETHGDAAAIERRLRHAAFNGRLVARSRAMPGLASSRAYAGYPALLATIVLLVWLLALVLQGEGLELDAQQRRHPMWEWLLSHPVAPGSVFAAEMLAPIAANPMFWAAPLLPAVLYGMVYDPMLAVLAGLVVGVPLTVAAACLGKALEIGVVLRLRMRTRGGVAGLLGWLGTLAFTVVFVGWGATVPIATALAGPLRGLAALPWPALGLMLGYRGDGGFSFGAGVLACDGLSSLLIVASLGFATWSARRGLSAPPEPHALVSSRLLARPIRFGRDPLIRKELLWFARDRGALVQAVLIPGSMAGLQMFNLRGLAAGAGDGWNTCCCAAILFGTYFLAVLGPRSLASEGTALWIALTWPRGLESLLKAKARLWTVLSSIMVAAVLAYAAWRFPDDRGAILLVGAGWLPFAHSMARKAVTLASVQGPSGEAERIPAGRRYAVYLGTLTFATGVQTQQWQVAFTGIVFSTLSAAAMWQNFRARLPYLHDPWSARPPTPPTLMHAMIAITLLVEIGAVLGGIALAVAGTGFAAIAWTLGYGLAATGVALGVARFLARRDVPARAVWCWTRGSTPDNRTPANPGTASLRAWIAALAVAALLGVALGLLARLYLDGLQRIIWVHDLLQHERDRIASVPHLHDAYLVLAVLIAPPAEEYLFRGLLFRALDREWGGWRAIAGSAVFFAIYHPVLSWLPVATLGAVNALLFKRTGRLAPAVLLHMVYNAVVLA